MNKLKKKNNKLFFQLWIVFICISLFNVVAAVSPIVVDKKNILSFNLIWIVWIITICITFYVKEYLLFVTNKIFDYLKKEKLLILIILISTVIRFPMLNTLPRWDAALYYKGIGEACAQYAFSISSIIDHFRLVGHSNIGYTLIMSFSEFLFPRNVLVADVWMLVLSVQALCCLYVYICKTGFSSVESFCITLCVSVVPSFLGLYEYFNPDYIIVILFINMLLLDKMQCDILCLWNTLLLSHVKETGVVIVAGYWGVRFVIQLIKTVNRKIEYNYKEMFKNKCFLIPFISGIAYIFYMIIIGGISSWNYEGKANMFSWDNQGIECFGFSPDYIIQQLKMFFVLNFSWILFMLALVITIVCAIRKKNKLLIFIKDNIHIIGTLLFLFVFGCLYITETTARYNILFCVLLTYLVASSFFEFFKDSIYSKIFSALIILVMIIQSYYMIDPLTYLVFDKINIGDTSLVLVDYRNKMDNTNIMEGARVRDSIVYNYQYSWLDKAYDDLLRKLKYSNSNDIIIVPGMEYAQSYVGGFAEEYDLNWNDKTRKRTFSNESSPFYYAVYNDTSLVCGIMNNWYMNEYAPYNSAIIMYVNYFKTNQEEDLKKYGSDYYVTENVRSKSFGGIIDGYRLIAKEDYCGLKIEDVLKSNKVDNISDDFMNEMNCLGFSEDEIYRRMNQLNLRILNNYYPENKDDTIDYGDYFEVRIVAKDQNGNTINARHTEGDITLIKAGAGMIDQELDDAIIGCKVGDTLIRDIDIPEFLDFPREIAGSKVHLEITIGEIFGYSKLNEINDEMSQENLNQAIAQMWSAYSSVVKKKWLLSKINGENFDEEIYKTDIDNVDIYFSGYLSDNRISEEEYINRYLNISKEEYIEAKKKLAMAGHLYNDITDIEAKSFESFYNQLSNK